MLLNGHTLFSLCLCLSVSLCLRHCQVVSVSVSLCFSVSVSLSLSLSVSVYLCLSVFLSLCLCLSVCLSDSLSLSLSAAVLFGTHSLTLLNYRTVSTDTFKSRYMSCYALIGDPSMLYLMIVTRLLHLFYLYNPVFNLPIHLLVMSVTNDLKAFYIKICLSLITFDAQSSFIPCVQRCVLA